MKPKAGDRILILKQPWLSMVLEKKKTMEIRSRPLTGKYYVGLKKEIFGEVLFGNPQYIANAREFRKLFPQHGVSAMPLYKKTYGLPILRTRCFKRPLPFAHTRGAQSIVLYR